MFKSSSTLENYKSTKCVIKRYIDGLVQPVADNFDIDISSLMTQSSINNGSSDEETETFMRLKKTHIKNTAIPDTAIHHYAGPKKPKISPEEIKPGLFSTEMIEKQTAIKKSKLRTRISILPNHLNQVQHFLLFWLQYQRIETKKISGGKNKKSMFTLLIEITLSDPGAMMAAMVAAATHNYENDFQC